MILGILVTLLGLSMVIFVHELGHLWAAKKSGVGVLEFSIGMGPKVFSRSFHGTLYAIRLLPLGGFVKLAGMDPDDTNSDIPVSSHFQSRPMAGRMLTIVAGSLMNLSFGFLLFVCLFAFSGKSVVSPIIEGVLPNSPAATVGLQAGDILQQINGQDIQDVTKDFIQKIQTSDSPLHIQVLRDDATFDISITPDKVNGRAQIGVRFSIAPERQPVKLREALDMGAQTTWGHITMVFKTVGMLFSGQVSVKDMAGPVGIIQFATAGLSHGFSQFIGIVAMISISLGIFNLFPFPVLDGGHLVLLLIEAVRGKPLSEKITNRIQQFGTIVLITLMIVILFNDVFQWQARWQLLGK